jgi:hypothetical protein
VALQDSNAMQSQKQLSAAERHTNDRSLSLLPHLGDLTRHGDCSRCTSEACLGLGEGASWLVVTPLLRSCSKEALP